MTDTISNTSSTTAFFSFNPIAGGWDRAEEPYAFDRPGYAIRRSTLKAVARVYGAIVKASYNASDEDLDAAPVIRQADDWVALADGAFIGYAGDSSTVHMIAACRAAGLWLHHNQEGGSWYASTPENVLRYLRSGGLWGYRD